VLGGCLSLVVGPCDDCTDPRLQVVCSHPAEMPP
jgi:hypothetical protein